MRRVRGGEGREEGALPGDEERRGGRAQGALDATEVKEADTRPHRRVRSPGARCTRHCRGDEEVRREKGERRGMGGDGATARWTTTRAECDGPGPTRRHHEGVSHTGGDFTQGTAADGGINNQSTGREEEGTRGGEEGTSSRGNRAPERGTEGKEGEDTRNGVGGECVYLLATEATSTT